MTGADEFLDLIGGLYEAALAPEYWQATLKDIATHLQSLGGILFVVDKRTGQAPFASCVNISDDMWNEYGQDYVHQDPRLAHALEIRPLALGTDYDHISEAEMDRSVFYTWLGNHDRLRYYFGAKLFENDRFVAINSFQRTKGQGHVQSQHVERYAALLPHIQRAVQLGQTLTELDLRGNAEDAALDAAPYGVLLLDTAGRILFANRVARAITDGTDGLVLGPEGLQCMRPSENRHLQRVIHGTIATGQGNGTRAGGAFSVMRPSGRKPYALTLAPVSGHDKLFAFLRPAAIVFLSDPEASPETPAGVLRQLYGLTPREADLAVQLGTGLSLDEAANQLAVAKETARRHIKSLFRKTDTRRQAELVRLLLTLPPATVAADR